MLGHKNVEMGGASRPNPFPCWIAVSMRMRYISLGLEVVADGALTSTADRLLGTLPVVMTNFDAENSVMIT
jgi:hypothetical protein